MIWDYQIPMNVVFLLMIGFTGVGWTLRAITENYLGRTI